MGASKGQTAPQLLVVLLFKGGSRKRVAVPHGRMRDGSNGKERSQVLSMGAAKKEPWRCDGAAYPITDPNCAAVGCWLCLWRCLEVVVIVVEVVCTKVGSACSASLPDPATLTQPDAVPSQQYGSSVAFTASSRIEAFSLWQVWAVGWCLVAPPPTAQIKFGGGFHGSTHTPPELAKLHRIVGRSCGAADHPAQAVRTQQATRRRITPGSWLPCPASQLSARRRHTRHT